MTSNKIIIAMKKYFFLSILLLHIINAQTNSESDDFSYPLKLYNQSLYDLAAKQFSKFYNTYPNSSKAPEAKYYAGMSYFKLGKFDLARIEFQAGAIEFPGSERAGECWFKTGECYARMDNKAEAAKAYETIRLLYPDDPLASKGLYLAGNLYSQIGNNEKARQLYRVIIDRYDTSDEYSLAIVKTAFSFFKMGDLQSANDLLDKVINGKSDNSSLAQAYFLKAKINQTQGNFDGAKNNFNMVIANYAGSDSYSSAVLELSHILMYEGQLEPARNLLADAINKEKVKDIQNKMHIIMGDINFLSGKYALALKEYGEGTDVVSPNDSTNVTIQLKIALSRYKQNLVENAINNIKTTLESHAIADEKTYNFIFEVYLNWLIQNGEQQQAINALFTRLNNSKTQSNKVKLATALAELLRQKGQWRDITQILQPYLFVSDKYPEMDDIVYYLGLAFENLGDYNQSVFYYTRILNEFNASSHYNEASDRLDYLNTYKIIDLDQALVQIANIQGNTLDKNSSSNELLFENAELFYDKLKNYELAEKRLNILLKLNPENIGDVYLLLGKTYLKLANKIENESENKISQSYRRKANDNFKLAVANITTCSHPDEASWLRISASLSGDSIKVSKEKTLIEALINKYPESPFLEDWYETLAYSLSFDEAYFESAAAYFKNLIDRFRNSDKYPTYLYSYAKLIQDKASEDAQKIFKRIASEYPQSSVAALALVEVADDYRVNAKYNEAYNLYNKLTNTYYYSELAHENKPKLVMTALKSGDYNAVISLSGETTRPLLSSDIILSKEFLGKDVSENFYLLAKAYEGKGDLKTALNYLQQYLNISVKGSYRDDARFEIGQIFYNQNQKGMALENFKLISKENETLYKDARVYMADIYFTQENYTQSASIYKEIRGLIEDASRLVLIDAQLVIATIRQGNIKESSVLIKQFKKDHSKEKNYLAQFEIEQGDFYRLKKDYSSARKKYEEVKKNYKSTDYVDDADYDLALVHLTLNENDKAFDILSNFYKNYSKSDKLPAALNSLGTLYYRSEKYDVAISMFKNALNACQDADLERSILSNLIQTYTLTSFWDAAQATARQYVEKFPDAADIIDKKIIIAQSYINLNQFENSIEYLRKIKFEADSEREPEVQYYIGEAYLKAGQYENAIAEFVKIPLLSKKTKLQWEASALYYSGQSYEKLGRIEDAVRMYQEIVNRPGIDLVLKKEAEKRIQQIQ